jgi:hypothetical protein
MTRDFPPRRKSPDFSRRGGAVLGTEEAGADRRDAMRARSRPIFPIFAAILLLILAPAAPAQTDREAPPQPERSRLEEHVATLAGPAFEGRAGAGARKAEAFVVEQFRRLGLEPAFDGSFTQDIPGKEPDSVVGRNVAARLAGSDPALRDDWIVVSAHYDHLGVHNGKVYPGADDDASGMAMLFEVARCLAEDGSRPRRSVLFVAFDLEENGLWGSRHFVAQPPVPLERIRLFLTADLIGGALGGVCTEHVFVMGSEHAPGLRPWIDGAAQGQRVKVATVGSDLLLIDRSDYGPFRARHVPYLFFSTGETPRYHTPQDTPETLDYPKLESITRVILGIVRTAAGADAAPGWAPAPEHAIGEALALRDVLKILLDHREDLKMGGAQVKLVTTTLDQLESIVRRGEYGPGDRARVLRLAQLVLVTVL